MNNNKHNTSDTAQSTRIVALSMVFVMSALPFLSHAVPPTPIDPAQIGREAQADAEILAQEFKDSMPSIDPVTGEITMSGGNIDINELFPGSADVDGGMAGIMPEGATKDVEFLRGLSEDDVTMDDVGTHNQAVLYQDGRPDNLNPTASGSAYRVMVESVNRHRVDMSNDPMFIQTNDIFANLDVETEGMGECTTDQVLENITRVEHIPNYRTCDRVVDKSSTCTVNHIYDAGVIAHHSGPFNIQPLDADSMQIWIGQIGDDYWSGNCSIFEAVTEYKVINPSAIVNARLDYAKWDDYIQIYAGPAGSEQLIWTGPDGNFPPETSGACELSTSWEENPNINVTNVFRNASPGDVIRFRIRVSVTGGGEGYARIQLDYDPNQVVMQDDWTNNGCIESVKAIEDGFASGTVECTAISTTAAAIGCETINGVRVCNSHFSDPPLAGIPALCQEVQVTTNYDFFTGTFCYDDASGQRRCVQGGTGSTNTCTAFEENPECGFVQQDCVEGAQSEDGTCYLFSEIWDCGYDVQFDDVQATTTTECEGEIRCMGNDCLDSTRTVSTSFAETAALLNAAQFSAQDMSCVEVDGTADVTCEVFGGEEKTCKIAVGGVQDCCDVPTQTSVGTYIHTMFQIGQLDSGLMALENGNAIKGVYQTLRQPVVNTVSQVTNPFVSYIENLSGATTELLQPVTEVVSGLKQQIQETIVNTINDMLGHTASQMGADGAAAAVASQAADSQVSGQAIVQNAANAANVLMTAYSAYITTVMVIQMAFPCEADEFKLAAMKDTKSCTYVGSYCAEDLLGVCVEKRESYCCFNSPMSRIVNEQIRPQLGRPFGDPANPSCDGVSMTEMGSVDWSQVDLGEWTALLAENDLLPDAGKIDIDYLTGRGSRLNPLTGNDSAREPDQIFNDAPEPVDWPEPIVEPEPDPEPDPDPIGDPEPDPDPIGDPEPDPCPTGCTTTVREETAALVSTGTYCPTSYSLNEDGSACTRETEELITPDRVAVDWNCPAGGEKIGSMDSNPQCRIVSGYSWPAEESAWNYGTTPTFWIRRASQVSSLDPRVEYLTCNPDTGRGTRNRFEGWAVACPSNINTEHMCERSYLDVTHQCTADLTFSTPEFVYANTCPDSYTLVGNMCSRPVTESIDPLESEGLFCEAGWTLDSEAGICWREVEVAIQW